MLLASSSGWLQDVFLSCPGQKETVPIPCAPFSFHVRYRFPKSASAWAAPFLVRSCAGLFPWPPGGSCAKGLCCSTVRSGQGQSSQPTVLPEEGRFPHPAERVRQNFPWQAQGLPRSLRLPEGIRPAPLRQGNRPRLWLQSSVSSMCSRRASPGHAGALQVAGEAPHTKQNLGDNLLKSRLFLPHGPFTGKSTGSSWVSVGNSNILALEAIRLDGLGCRILEVSGPQDPSNIDKFSENVFAS